MPGTLHYDSWFFYLTGPFLAMDHNAFLKIDNLTLIIIEWPSFCVSVFLSRRILKQFKPNVAYFKGAPKHKCQATQAFSMPKL